MAVDREKKLAEDASQLGCFQKVVLGWDYVQILKDSTLVRSIPSAGNFLGNVLILFPDGCG